MKSSRKFFNLTIVTIVIAASGLPIVRAQDAPPVTSASRSINAAASEGSLALNDQLNWKSFLKLAAKPNGIVTVKDLEGAFGQKAVYQKKVGLYDSYSIKDFITLFTNDDQFAKKQHPELTFNEVSFRFLGKYQETCITRDQAISDLQKFGWALRAHSPVEGNFREMMPADMKVGSDMLTKGDQGVLRLIFSITNCATTIVMQSNKLAFDKVIQANN
jgi:hypothetical protein